MFTRENLKNKLIEVDQIDERFKQASHIICMSNILKEICQDIGINESKITVLGNRVSVKRFFYQEQENYDNKIIRILYVGRLEHQKNLHGLTNALKLLKDKNWGIDLNICGGTGINDYLRECLSVLDQTDWRYHGNVQNRDLPELYKTVDMYVGPSFFEGFQIPLIEAMASGKPCVASNQPPATEIINEEIGALIDPDSAKSIADGIEKIKLQLNNPEKRGELIQKCVDEANRKWSYDVVSRKEAQIYLDLWREKND